MLRTDLRVVARMAVAGSAIALTACGHSLGPASEAAVDASTDHREVEPVDTGSAEPVEGGIAEPGEGSATEDAGATPESGLDGATDADDAGCVSAGCGDVQCGAVYDRCGARDCGHCASTFACWQGSCVPAASLHDAGCKPTSCDALGIACGVVDDDCGSLLDCGHCAAPAVCGGADGHHCAPPPVGPDGGPACTHVICSEQPPQGCGLQTDGCGGAVSCGVPGCVGFGGPLATCGGSGVRFSCGTGATCVPLTCAPFGYDCGQIADGCGGFAACGTCPAGRACGTGGFNLCGPGP
jgi:hypothetical protein